MDVINTIIELIQNLLEFLIVELFWESFIIDLLWENINIFLLNILNPLTEKLIPFFVSILLYFFPVVFLFLILHSEYDERVGTARDSKTGEFRPVSMHAVSYFALIVIIELFMHFVLVPIVNYIELKIFYSVNDNCIFVIIFILLNLSIGLSLLFWIVSSQSGGLSKVLRSIRN